MHALARVIIPSQPSPRMVRAGFESTVFEFHAMAGDSGEPDLCEWEDPTGNGRGQLAVRQGLMR